MTRPSEIYRPRMCMLLLLWLPTAVAQVPENTDDPTGMAIAYPFVHLMHSSDTAVEGGTAWLRENDPWLLYVLGRDMVLRRFTREQGAAGRVAELSVPLYDHVPPSFKAELSVPRFARDQAAGCASCHSIPAREPGGGQTMSSTGGAGRDTPHFFGAGLVEMIGQDIQRQILERYDLNHDGLFDVGEVLNAPVKVTPWDGTGEIDFGSLTPDAQGVPRLNAVFRVWYADARGRVLPEALTLHDEGVAAFGITMQVFGWGRGYAEVRSLRLAQGAEAATLREIFVSAASLHIGMQAHDPSQAGPLSLMRSSRLPCSLSGAFQNGTDEALVTSEKTNKHGVSLDDPDHDGVTSELTEGDVDAAEFFMLNAPAPAFRSSLGASHGRELFRAVGCVQCHVENWRLPAHSSEPYPGRAGDRRYFEFRTAFDGTMRELTGSLVPKTEMINKRFVPKGDSVVVENVYSDFKHWDIGQQFHERRFDGTVQKEHRTAPLWGCGSTAPYGHSGKFLTLDAAILAHAGAAQAVMQGYGALSPKDKGDIGTFLRSLVLFQSEFIRADIDGDGKCCDDFFIGGVHCGWERLDPRWLFRVPVRMESRHSALDATGRKISLGMATHVLESYGLQLNARRATRETRFPDILSAP